MVNANRFKTRQRIPQFGRVCRQVRIVILERLLVGIKDFPMFLLLLEQNVLVDRLCDLFAYTLTSDVVSPEVLPCVNTA